MPSNTGARSVGSSASKNLRSRDDLDHNTNIDHDNKLLEGVLERSASRENFNLEIQIFLKSKIHRFTVFNYIPEGGVVFRLTFFPNTRPTTHPSPYFSCLVVF
jgi:hypothetical protein